MKHRLPIMLGVAMGAMMLAMAHPALVAGRAPGGLVLFAVGHVAVVAIALTGGVAAARLAPAWRARLARLHRPNLRHMCLMAGSAVASAAAIHLIHGGPGA